MPADESTMRRWGRIASALCAGIAVTLLVWSVGLGLWSWLVAEPSPALGAWQKIHYSPWGTDSLGADTPRTIAVTVCWISAVLLAGVLAAWLLRRARFPVWALIGLAAVCALGLIYLRSGGLADFVGWMQAHPRTAQLPTAVTAWRLETLAVIALAAGCPAIVQLARRSWRKPAILGVVAGLVLALSATGLAWYGGSDSRFVEASVTATPVPDLAVPGAFGTKHFTVQIASASDHNGWYVQPIVGGFVTVGDGRVTAFDGKGNERWHYRRSGPGTSQVFSLQVFDDGRTVVIGVGPSPSVLIGFDAATGTQLWWSSDPHLLGAQHVTTMRHAASPQTNLFGLDTKTHTWTRFDTRTGTPLWTTAAPEPTCAQREDVLAHGPQALLWCPRDGRDELRLASINPENGETEWQTTISTESPFNGVTAYAAGRDGIVAWFSHGRTGHYSSYVNTATRQAHQMVSAAFPIDTVDDAVDFLALVGQRISLRGNDGKERCAFSNGPPLVDLGGKAVILHDQVIFGIAPGLQTFNPNTCAPLGSITLPSIPLALLATPGVVLVVRADATGTWVDGYA